MYRIVSTEERDYLSQYSIADFERPSVAADIAVFRISEQAEEDKKKKRPKKLQVLLIKRANYPYKNCWVLPGGFCRQGERVWEAAARELKEETGLSDAVLQLIGVYSEPDRDPRGWIISNTYMALIRDGDFVLRTDAEAWEAKWFSLEELGKLNIGFDHREILGDAFKLLKYSAKYNFERIFDLLPETFTLADLQQVFEVILEVKLIKPNFRRKMMEFLEETGEIETGYSHRNSKKYRKNIRHFSFM